MKNKCFYHVGFGLLCSLILLVCQKNEPFIQATTTDNSSKKIISAEKYQWPESPVPKSLGRGAKKRGGKGKR